MNEANRIDLTINANYFVCMSFRSVTDPRDGARVALKKMPNVFQNMVSCRRVFREIRMLCSLQHDNVLQALDILQPPHIDFFQEMLDNHHYHYYYYDASNY